MKRFLFVILTFLICFSFFNKDALALGKASSSADKQPQNVVISQDEIVDRDLFLAGSTVTISGIVNGDVFVGTNNLVVDGIINGDLIAGANTITFSGEVTDDLRLAANTISISGLVGKNATIFGNSLTVSSKAQIFGSVLAGGQIVNLGGPVGKDVTVYAQEVNLAGLVGRNLKGSFQRANFNEGARIMGNLDYQAPQELEIEEGMVIGETNYQKLESKADFPKKGFLRGFAPVAFMGVIGISFYLRFMALLIAIGLGLLFLYLFPKRTKGVIEVIQKRPWVSLGVGVLTPIIFAFSMIFLTISIIGIPFLFILIPLFALVIYFSKIFVAFFIGNKILSNTKIKNPLGWGLAIGLAIYYILTILPIIGGITSFAFITIGLGAFVLDVKTSRRASKKK